MDFDRERPHATPGGQPNPTVRLEQGLSSLVGDLIESRSEVVDLNENTADVFLGLVSADVGVCSGLEKRLDGFDGQPPGALRAAGEAHHDQILREQGSFHTVTPLIDDVKAEASQKDCSPPPHGIRADHSAPHPWTIEVGVQRRLEDVGGQSVDDRMRPCQYARVPARSAGEHSTEGLLLSKSVPQRTGCSSQVYINGSVTGHRSAETSQCRDREASYILLISDRLADRIQFGANLVVHRPEELILREERSAAPLTVNGGIPLAVHGLMDRLQELE